MLFTRKVNIVFAYLTLCRCKGFGNINIDIVQAINGISSKTDSWRQVQLYDCRDWQQTIESNEGVGIWYTPNWKIHRLPDIRNRSCMFQQKRYQGLLFQVWWTLQGSMITLLCNISDNKFRITQKCNDIIWRYKYICNRNNQVDKIIKQTKLLKRSNAGS